MTCMDCVHYELCRDSGLLMNDLMKTKEFRKNLEETCPFKKFKNKTEFKKIVRCERCKHKESCEQYLYVDSNRTELVFCSYGEPQ